MSPCDNLPQNLTEGFKTGFVDSHSFGFPTFFVVFFRNYCHVRACVELDLHKVLFSAVSRSTLANHDWSTWSNTPTKATPEWTFLAIVSTVFTDRHIILKYPTYLHLK